MNKFMFFVATLLMLITACKEDTLGVLNDDGGTIPGAVTNVQVKNIPGGAVLHFSIPDSKNLLYVKGEFESKGIIREVRTSIFVDTLLIEGLPNTDPREVKLYAVSRSEKSSLPITVVINPMTPPVQVAFASLKTYPDFGGLTATYNNPSQANLSYFIIVIDAKGYNDKLTSAAYSKFKDGYWSKTGLDPVPTEFGIYVRDRWNNYSDTMKITVTPLYETKLDKTLFKTGINGTVLGTPAWSIAGFNPDFADLGADNSSYNGLYLFNNLFDEDYKDAAGLFHTKTNAGVSAHFTIDLGVTKKLSRYKYYMRGAVDAPQLMYGGANPKSWEIWGSNNPNPDGSWDTWTKIMTNECPKPSGSPLIGLNTPIDDKAFATAGIEFRFPIDTPPYRYIRWKNTSTWENFTYLTIQELTFWGQ